MSSVTSVSMFSLRSSSFPKPTSASTSSPRFSRVSFATVSMHSEGRSWSWKLKATSGDEKSAFEEKISEGQKAASDLNEAIKEKALEINEGVKDQGDEINKGNKANLQSIKDKNDEVVGVLSEKSKEASKSAADNAEEVKGALQGAWDAATKKAEDVKNAVEGKDGA